MLISRRRQVKMIGRKDVKSRHGAMGGVMVLALVDQEEGVIA
jgi:hypothetical protein